MLNNFKKIFDIEARTKYFVHVLAFFLAASLLVFALLLIGQRALNRKPAPASAEKENPFAALSLEARSAIVWDVVKEKEIFTKHADKPLPLASLTKVMTALTIEGKLSAGQEVMITPEDLAPDGDSQLVVGDSWRAGDLRDFTLLTSSNDGAFALAAVSGKTESFVNDMNRTALSIGLSNSKFFNEHGLDTATDKGGAYGSAKDMALLFEYILKNHPEILEATRYKNLEFKSARETYDVGNTNTITDKIPGLIASKTGYTDLAGGNLVVAFDAGLNRPIIISVLGSSEEGRFADVLQLVEASLKYIHDN